MVNHKNIINLIMFFSCNQLLKYDIVYLEVLEMKLELEPNSIYVKNGKFNQYEALKSVGVKAAVCFKETVNNQAISPQDIRNSESDAILINRAVNTILSDHTTPSEHQVISLELTGIPKILCMILNNEHQYTADERSLRYTEVEPNNYITELEVSLYNKWLNIFEKLITNEMWDFYIKYNKNEKLARKAIHKIAQENARYMVSVFMPTTITYTVPWIQLNKIICYMQNIINNPLNELEELLIPHLNQFINLCIQKNVVITKNSLYDVANTNNEVKEKLYKTHQEIQNYQDNNDFIYKNNKSVDLSLFAYRNKFSGINDDNEYGFNISYNNYESLACLAQEQRHRTIDCEMLLPDTFNCYVPLILECNTNLKNEWIQDMNKVSRLYPQGQLIKVNRSMSIKNMLKYVSQERACDMAQLEIERIYTHDIIPDVYNGLINNNYNNLVEIVKPYVKKLRCGFPGYTCPNPCHHPRIDRKI